MDDEADDDAGEDVDKVVPVVEVVVSVVVSLAPAPDVPLAVDVVSVVTEEASASVAHSFAMADRFACCSAAFFSRFFLPERPPFVSFGVGAPLSLLATSWLSTWPFCFPPDDDLPPPVGAPLLSVGLFERFVTDDDEDEDEDDELPLPDGSLSQSLRLCAAWDVPDASFVSFPLPPLK